MPLYFPSDAQKLILRKEMDKLSPVLWERLFLRANYALFVQNTPDGLDIFFIPKDFMQDLKAESLRKAVHAAGLHLGKLVQSRLQLDLDGAWEVNAKGGDALSRVTLINEGEKSFLYHRFVPWSNVTKSPPNIGIGQTVFVNNAHGENLGIATVAPAKDSKSGPRGEDWVLVPHVDRGYFLRGAG